MKTVLCILLFAAAVFAVEEKKNEKRGLLGLGYGLGAAPISHGYYGHGLGLYGHGIASAPIVSHGLAAAPIVSHGYYGGHGLGLYDQYDHGLAAPVISHGISYGAPLGLGHYGIGHGWH
ncbi:glycine-rich protein-like [Bombyx mandarina]|uniref:Glycine-rich protein-like n=1 Tax=Bombyx mandarina TaxID=7092 RepID=A0A6J2KDD2_BOMMA|nr:glycine-rich protein-like [Bombyx mandarina]